MRLRSVPSVRSLAVSALVFVALSLAPDARAAAPPADAKTTLPTPAQQRATLFVSWGGSWWAAEAVASDKNGNVHVHYVDWDKSWDETVPPSRMKRRTTAGQGQLFVAWGGSWWPATILATERDGRALIHYDGWGKEWDETVDASRMLRLV